MGLTLALKCKDEGQGMKLHSQYIWVMRGRPRVGTFVLKDEGTEFRINIL
jgi:hypothetical protein